MQTAQQRGALTAASLAAGLALLLVRTTCPGAEFCHLDLTSPVEADFERQLSRAALFDFPSTATPVAAAAAASAAPPAAPAQAAARRIVPNSETRATVVFVTRIVSRGPQALRNARLHVHAPVALPHQDITELDIEGDPERLADAWQSPILLYQRPTLAPGACLVGRWTATATLRRFRWDWQAAPSDNLPALSPEQQALCLRNGKDLALEHPVIEAAAAEAARAKTGTVAVLDGAFGLVMDRLSYDRDGKWQPAPEVLSSGKGSCSEYTYCFLALCRKNRIPARYVGGIVGRLGVPFHLDKVFHRFPQAHVPGFGWVDFDPTRNERANNKRLYFGQTPGPMLITAVGDSGEGSLTGSDYLEKHDWDGTPAQASGMRQAWWFPPPAPDVRARVAQFRQRLGSAAGQARAVLAQEALNIGHPFVLPWLDDLLYEPGLRVPAARAALQIGGDAELAAIVNCLERLNDADGDRQIGRLLEGFTGQSFGTHRARWNEWLKARTPRTPLPGDTPKKKP
ncbi:MAG: transglutaminase domain-containing protein [Verrucomicrobia bacterium]|nr:transglutaminase domain-containing protein [Verrucomicrobiota bacterium]